MPHPYIQFDGITKKFAGVTALDAVTFDIGRGECHALMGENGAGKSTLGKVLAGIHRADEGRLLIGGEQYSFANPADAMRAGVGMVHQELAFCPALTVSENLNMGQYPTRFGMISRKKMDQRARQLLSKIGANLDVHQPMRDLSTAQEQLVQIASAVGTGANILVFDEPTASLSEVEAQHLFKLIEQLKASGVTIIYVSHRMPEVLKLCDRISVLRDGKYVGTLERSQATQDRVVQMMIGRAVADYFPNISDKIGDTLLHVVALSSPGKFADVSFTLRRGEILGFAGLVGAGRSEIAKAIFGLDPDATGEVTLEGASLELGSVKRSIHRGIGLVPEDRKRQGLVLMMSGRANASLAVLDRLKRLFGLLDKRTERRDAARLFAQMRVKTPSLETPVAALSGGNQQKVALAKWLIRNCKLLIVDEPTRGVDVGAKAAIHQLLDELARRGVGIMLISSELPEVLNLSTRVLIMREGRLVGELSRAQANQENAMRLMAGVA